MHPSLQTPVSHDRLLPICRCRCAPATSFQGVYENMKRLLMLALATGFLGGMLGDVALAGKKGKKKDPMAVFKKLDANGDKKLSETEFVGKKTGKKADKARKRFKKLDKSGDGFLSFEEFKARKKKKAK
jgi:EF-hand domain pair